MIDSHCHLDHEPLLSDLTNVIRRSKDIGIEKLLTISTSLESFNKIKEIIKKDKIIFGTIGIHPHETKDNQINADIIIKATKVDGVYDKDPMKFDSAKKYDKITFKEVINTVDKLKIFEKILEFAFNSERILA